jgi:hypothetical protein
MSLPKLATTIVLIGILAMAVRVPTSPDMWWHLRCGEVQWRTRAVLRTETFSHTASGAPWVNQSWLPQLAMYALYAWGRFPVLALAVGMLVAVTFGLVHGASSAEGRAVPPWWSPYWRAGIVLWAAIASGPTWATRPHLLTLLLTALWVYLLERWRAGGRKAKDLAWLPPLTLLWANSHGGYVVGLLLLLAEIAGQALDAATAASPCRDTEARAGHRDAPPTTGELTDPATVAAASPCRDTEARAGHRDAPPTAIWAHARPLLLVALLCLLAALVNPQGIHLLLFPFRTLGSTAQQAMIAEWASPDFHARELWPFLGLLLAAWAALALSRRPVLGSDLLRALGFSAMALRSSRYIGLAAVILAPLLVRHGADVLARMGKKRARISPGTRAGSASAGGAVRGWPAVNWGLLAVVLLGAGIKMAQPLNAQTIDRVHRQLFPVVAAEVLRADALQERMLPPELLNEYGWGGYLIWANSPHTRVFIDGRADPYGEELIAAYRDIFSARPGWQEGLERYGVRTALLATGSALGAIMRESVEWREVYADEVAAIYVRSD